MCGHCNSRITRISRKLKYDKDIKGTTSILTIVKDNSIEFNRYVTFVQDYERHCSTPCNNEENEQ